MSAPTNTVKHTPTPGPWFADEDDRCDYCADRAPAGEYYRCPKCDAEWPAEDEGEQDDVGATASSTNSNSQPTKGESDAKSAHDDSVFEEALIDRRRQDAAQAERQQPIGHENAPVESAADTISATNSHSPDTLPVEANSAGEAPSSSQASPVTHSDFDPSRDIPAFMRRTDKGSIAPRGQQDGFNPNKVG